ncbi:alpha/beta hydrolase [Streptomyces avicenniae]|uniref:alpha/beta hydrolase n=1 Tax=Streptomyces avicenniae TaxID=500153 RepID=UPI000A8E90FE|nr:alpha/beta hydrolase [Streptomyces avicenniae]
MKTRTPFAHRGRRPGRAAAALAAVAAVALLVGACTNDTLRPGGVRPTDAASTGSTESYEGLPDAIGLQELSWETCQEPTPIQGTGTGTAPGEDWECSTLTVPLDYDEPDGGTIGIALIRAATTAPADERIGSLVFNFGGPGASGVATLPAFEGEYEALRDGGYDLVSFDPRGVGESAGVVCLDAEAVDEQQQEDTGPPETAAELAEADAQDAAYIAACERNAGDLLPHVSTANAARDMDVLRHVLGDARLHYFGISYGTQLGAVYAHLFPGTVGRTVLDAVVDPSPDVLTQVGLQTEGFQLALDHYLADCAEHEGADCPTGTDPAAGGAVITDLLDSLEDAPLPTSDPDGRELTSGLAMTGILSTLYSEEAWQYLTQGLQEVTLQGTGNLLLLLADFYNGRDSQGRYSNQGDAFTAIQCADDPASGMSVEEAREHEDELLALSPVFGEMMMWGLTGCGDWPVPAAETERPEYGAPDAASPVLLVATTGDPATPYEGAARMQEAIGGPDVAPLLSYDGEGHSAYTTGDECVVGTVNAHLLEGTVPEDGTRCG